MRIQTLLLWTFAMLCGTVLMFIAGLVWFPLESTKIAKDVPQSQVLVAKEDIPAGARIHAEFVEYRFVPVRSIPVGATTDFHRIYNRKTIYPIAEGTPICDMDLDTPMSEKVNDQLRVPFGMNVVRIQVDRVQTNDAPVGDEITAEVLSQVVHPGDTVDLMLVETAQKVALSANRSPFGFTNRNRTESGNKDTVYHRKPTQLIASDLKVYAFSEKTMKESSPMAKEDTTSSATQPVISLLMSKDQLDEVKKAAKIGRLQIVLHTENADESVQEETNLPQSSSRPRMIVQASATQSRSRFPNVHTANYVAEIPDEPQTEIQPETDDAFAEVPVESFVEPVFEEPAAEEPAAEEPVEESLPEIAEEETNPEPVCEPVEEENEEQPLPEIVTAPIAEPIIEPILETTEEPIVRTEEIIEEPALEIAEEQPIGEPTLAPPFPEAVVNTATEPTLAPPFPKIADQVNEPIVEEDFRTRKPLTLSAPVSPEEKPSRPVSQISSRSAKQQPVVKIGLTPLKRRQARLDRTVPVPPQSVKSTVKPEQFPPNDYVTREYDSDNMPETSQEVIRIVSFGRKKKIDLYPHYFYEPTSLLLSPDRVATQERPTTWR